MFHHFGVTLLSSVLWCCAMCSGDVQCSCCCYSWHATLATTVGLLNVIVNMQLNMPQTIMIYNIEVSSFTTSNSLKQLSDKSFLEYTQNIPHSLPIQNTTNTANTANRAGLRLFVFLMWIQYSFGISLDKSYLHSSNIPPFNPHPPPTVGNIDIGVIFPSYPHPLIPFSSSVLGAIIVILKSKFHHGILMTLGKF